MPPQPPRHLLFLLAGAVLLAAAVGLVFGPTVGYEFLNYDDGPYVYENPHVACGFTASGVVWAFTQRHASNWHPVTWLSHMLDCQWYGLQPWGHHLTNLVLHAANAGLLLLLLYQWTGRFGPSLFVALVFAVHPLRVESVAWVAERKDVLSGLWFMLTLLAYTSYVRRPFSLVRYLLVLLPYALGLMSKPMLVSVPGVLLLLDYWPLRRVFPDSLPAVRRSWRWLVWEKAPFCALALGSAAVTVWAQSRGLKSGESIAFAWRAANAAGSYVVYIVQLFWSRGQPFYPHPRETLSLAMAAGALALLAAISAACIAGRKRAPYLVVGWAWYLVMLLPVIGLVQVGAQAVAERYTYLPHIGLCLLLAWGAADVLRRVKFDRPIALLAGALIVALLAVRTARQLAPWHGSVSFWRHVIGTDPDAKLPDARYSLGVALQEQGRPEEAIEAYRQALALVPNYASAHNNLANVLLGGGRLPEAIDHYRHALRIDPQYVAAHYNLGTALDRQGRFEEALAAFHAALALDPDCVEAYNNLANALSAQGRVEEAAQHFERALRLRPQAAEIHYNLAQLLARAERWEAAVAHWREAAALRPAQGVFRAALAVGNYRLGRLADAAGEWRVALRLQPDAVDVLQSLAWLLATAPDASLRNGPEAVALAERAAELAPSVSPELLDTLAAAYAQSGRFAEAVTAAQRAQALAAARNEPALAAVIGQRLLGYRQERPFRDER